MIDLEKQYQKYLNKNIYINMSRGVPDARQLDLSESILNVLRSGNCLKINNNDYRNYGLLDGIPECKKMFSYITGLKEESIIIKEQLEYLFKKDPYYIHEYYKKKEIQKYIKKY